MSTDAFQTDAQSWQERIQESEPKKIGLGFLAAAGILAALCVAKKAVEKRAVMEARV